MTEPEVHIRSYFSLETNLAKEFSCWSEFVEGDGYNVLLRSQDGEEVSTKFISKTENENEEQYVIIKGNQYDLLFQRVLGHATYFLAQHSDNLLIHEWSKTT